jgi:hypothetical protein
MFFTAAFLDYVATGILSPTDDDFDAAYISRKTTAHEVKREMLAI